MRIVSILWQNVGSIVMKLVPPLTHSLHKGQMGRIAVVGGSQDYTGAPYYAAEASLRFGGDLAFVFCGSEAAMPIKSYSPELIVTPIYDAHELHFEKMTHQ